MTREFEERKTAEYTDDPIDLEAIRFVKSWHRYPPLHEAVWYNGVNLGEMSEYALIPEVIAALLDREEGRPK